MKKFITALVLATMLLATLGVAASAESYMIKPSGICEYEVTIKKADPAVVVKDGVIDVEGGEYIKAEVPFEELSVNFRNADNYLSADAMAKTMEYYFSWDETHGFNFAVKYLAKGTVEDYEYDGYFTNIPAGTGSDDPAIPQDNFLFNMGLAFASGDNPDNPEQSFLYHCIGKSLDGTYLTGWWTQRGTSGAFSAEGGKDFEVAYPGDGSVIFEWSIPFAEFIKDTPAAGVEFPFTLAATAGTDTAEEYSVSSWCVSLGQRGAFLITLADTNAYATGILSDEPVKEIAAPATSDAESSDVESSKPVVTDPFIDPPISDVPTQEPATSIVTDIVTSYVTETDDNGDVMTDDKGDAVTNVVSDVVSSVVTQKPDNNSPVTGDPVIIAAVVAAISACGVVVAKKRK